MFLMGTPMVMQFEYPRNALLDLSPINDAIDFRAKQQGMEDARQKAFVQKAAGIAQMISQEKDPAVASARWGQLVNSDPRWGNALKASGVDPNDYRTGAQMIIAEARGYQDPLDQKLKEGQLDNQALQRQQTEFSLSQARANAPLERQMKEAQIAKLEREALTGDNPAAVREWQFFSKLDPAAQERYLTMKRSDKYLDTGTSFVRPSQVDPTAPPVASVPKNVAEEARLRKVGTETGELQAGAPKAEAAMRSADAKHDIVINNLDEAIKLAGPTTTGIGGAVLSNVPGTAAYDMKQRLKTVIANSGFDELQTMRDNSPTGGALGQVAVQELEMLQKIRGSLEQAQSEPQLRAIAKEFRDFMAGSKERRRKAFESTYGAARQQGTGGQGSGGVNPDAVKLLQSDPSPLRRQQFDAIFGQGAADRALGGR